MSDPLTPSPQVLVKLGSAIIHAAEFLSPQGYPLDKQAFNQLLVDPDVLLWIRQMDEMGMLPVMRNLKK